VQPCRWRRTIVSLLPPRALGEVLVIALVSIALVALTLIVTLVLVVIIVTALAVVYAAVARPMAARLLSTDAGDDAASCSSA
jgi:Na+/glutamate symporter